MQLKQREVIVIHLSNGQRQRIHYICTSKNNNWDTFSWTLQSFDIHQANVSHSQPIFSPIRNPILQPKSKMN